MQIPFFQVVSIIDNLGDSCWGSQNFLKVKGGIWRYLEKNREFLETYFGNFSRYLYRGSKLTTNWLHVRLDFWLYA